jgi:hypothetical protein
VVAGRGAVRAGAGDASGAGADGGGDYYREVAVGAVPSIAMTSAAEIGPIGGSRLTYLNMYTCTVLAFRSA